MKPIFIDHKKIKVHLQGVKFMLKKIKKGHDNDCLGDLLLATLNENADQS